MDGKDGGTEYTAAGRQCSLEQNGFNTFLTEPNRRQTGTKGGHGREGGERGKKRI